MNRGCDIIAKKRILVVEDEAIVAEDIRKTLNNMGYDVPSTASSGEEAMKKVGEIGPDLVLMDIILQGKMDGVETAGQITSRFNIPVIYLTAHSDKKTLERAKITDPFGYIIKPFKEKELKMAIEIALFKHGTEEIIRASEIKYRTLLENIPQKIFHKDKNLCYVSCNNNYARDLKIQPDEIVGKTDYNFYPEELAEKYREDDKRIIESGKAEDIEEYYILNGQKVIVHTVKTPIRDKDGNTTGVLGIFWDITESKRAEEALRQSEERYRNLVDNAKDVIFTLSTDGTITSLNPSFETTTGWSRSDWLGKTFPSIIHPDDLSFAMEVFQHILLGEVSPSSFELRVLSKSGIYITMDFVVTPQFLDGKAVNVLGICRDITERKRTEEALKLSEEKYRTLIDNIQDGVFIIQDARIQFANEAFARIAGYTVEEITGRNFQELVAPEDLEMVTDRYRRRQVGDDVAKEYEFGMLHKDGTRIIVNMNVGLINYYGRIASMGTIKDITERKKAELEYKTILRTAMDGFYVIDSKGCIQDVNDSYCRLIGYSRDELLNMSLKDIEAAETKEEIAQHIRQITEVGQASFETRHKCKDGKIIDIEASINYLGVGGGKFFVFVRDITERKRAEGKMRFQGQIIEIMAEGVIIIRANDGTIVYANPTFEHMFGYEPGELVGMDISIINAPNEKNPEDVAAEIRGALNKNGEWRGEVYNVRKDGTKLWCHANVSTFEHPEYGKVWISVHEDITESKQAEEALRESEDRYRRLVDSSPDGVIVHNLHELTFINPAAAKILGAAKPEELIGKPIAEIIHPDHRDIAKKRLLMEKEGKDVPLVDEKFLRLDGTPIDVEVVAIPSTNEGKLEVHSIIRDITERKRAEEEIQYRSQIQTSLNNLLKISLENISLDKVLEQVIDHLTSICWLSLESRGGIWLIEDDTDMLVLKAQKGFPSSLLSACSRIPVGRCICGRAARSGKLEFADSEDKRHENTYPGMVPHYHYCIPLVSSGKVLGVVNLYLKHGHQYDKKEEDFLYAIADVLVGIIQRKQAEEALSRSNEFSRNILDSINDAICIIDVHDFKIAGFNSVFLKEIGQRGEDVIGRTCYEVTHLRSDPCEPPDDICPLLETARTGKHYVVEHLHHGSDGKKTYVEVSTSPVMDDRGRITQVVHVSRDITERKLVEERLRHVNIELKKADKLKTQFLSISSHELRTPLTPMKAQLQMIIGGYLGDLTETQKKSLDMILNNATRLDRLIGDILDISKLEAGSMRFIMTRASLNEVVESAVETMKPQAQGKQITVTMKEDKIPEMAFDKDRITQVIVNLINNAIKFTDPGGRINIELSGNTDHAIISVSDNGIGIKKEDIEKLFKPFQQVDSSETRRYEGTGLGLAICRGIVTYHGGKIWVESEFGKGSVFRFILPYRAEIKEEKVELDLLEKVSVNERDVR